MAYKEVRYSPLHYLLLVLRVMVSNSYSVLKELKIKSRNSIVCITFWPLLPLVTYSKIVSTFLSCEPEAYVYVGV